MKDKEPQVDALRAQAETPRLFPIMCGERPSSHVSWIPWAVIAPHEAQAHRNHDQTLLRLAQRGGLSPCEAVAVLEDRKWRAMPQQEARLRLGEIVESALRALAEERDSWRTRFGLQLSSGWQTAEQAVAMHEDRYKRDGQTITRLRETLLGLQSHDLTSETPPCWCGVSLGVGTEHAEHCRAATAALQADGEAPTRAGDHHMILCSECYDRLKRAEFTAILPQSTCAECGRICLGYQVVDVDEQVEPKVDG